MNENNFNAWLSKELRTMHGRGFHHVKISDKFTAGISDFIIWGMNSSVVIESKYISELPQKDSTKLLTHPFEGDQQTFMESVSLTGNRAFGLVAIGDKTRGSLFLIENKVIPPSGNWKTKDFLMGYPKRIYPWSDWRQMIVYALTGRE